MSQYLPKKYRSFWENAKVELDLPSYPTKLQLKEATGIDSSNFALKSNLAILKAETDKIYIGKLKAVSVDLSKLSNIVKNEFIKKTVYDKLVAIVNNIDTSGLILKTECNTDKLDL